MLSIVYSSSILDSPRRLPLVVRRLEAVVSLPESCSLFLVGLPLEPVPDSTDSSSDTSLWFRFERLVLVATEESSSSFSSPFLALVDLLVDLVDLLPAD